MSANQREPSILARAMGPVARELLGEPNEDLSTDDDLKFGTRGSMAVNLKAGTYYDHAAGEGGGVLDLVMRHRHTDKDGALAWLRERKHIPEPSGMNIVARYPYTDPDGKLLYEVVRLDPKDFRQRRPAGAGGWIWKTKGMQLVLYRLPSVLAAIQAGKVVYVTEGEKSADALAAAGLTATCAPRGACKWRDEYSPTLAGADVVLLPDNDDPGRKHVAMVAASLRRMSEPVAALRVLTLPGLPDKGDVFDWLQAGGTVAELAALTDAALEPATAAEPATASRAMTAG